MGEEWGNVLGEFWGELRGWRVFGKSEGVLEISGEVTGILEKRGLKRESENEPWRLQNWSQNQLREGCFYSQKNECKPHFSPLWF